MSEHPATRAYRAFARAFAAGLPALLACFLPHVRRLPTLPQRPAAPQIQPRTLHQALAANPRPVRPYLDARPTRTPPAQRRR